MKLNRCAPALCSFTKSKYGAEDEDVSKRIEKSMDVRTTQRLLRESRLLVRHVRTPNTVMFSKPPAWDIGKRFRRIMKLAGITDLRIHDSLHFAITMLSIEGVSGAIIRKMAGTALMSWNDTNTSHNHSYNRPANLSPES